MFALMQSRPELPVKEGLDFTPHLVSFLLPAQMFALVCGELDCGARQAEN